MTLTRLLAEAALALGLPVLASETHGMAQRGGTVISMVKVGPFRGPLIPLGRADLGLFLFAKNLDQHRAYLKPDGALVVNTTRPGDYWGVDAQGLALKAGLPPVTANLVLVGFAAGLNLLFCPVELLEKLVQEKTAPRFREGNLRALAAGLKAATAFSLPER